MGREILTFAVADKNSTVKHGLVNYYASNAHMISDTGIGGSIMYESVARKIKCRLKFASISDAENCA